MRLSLLFSGCTWVECCFSLQQTNKSIPDKKKVEVSHKFPMMFRFAELNTYEYVFLAYNMPLTRTFIIWKRNRPFFVVLLSTYLYNVDQPVF